MKTTLSLLAALAVLAGVVLMQRHRIQRLRQENNALNTNVEALMEGSRRYRTADSLHAAGIEALEMRLSEYKKWRQQDAELIESLKIRLRRIESVARHTTQSGYRLVVPVRDTVYLYRDRPDTARTFVHRSPYIDLRGRLERDSVALDFTTRDTLVQVVHRVPRRFLFLRYGTRSLRQEIVSRNPHTQITYTEYIKLNK